MADATRQRTIYQIQQILKAYKAKLEKASTYRDFLSAEGKSLTDDYMEKNSETKSLIEKAVSDPSFFLNMENDNLIRYSDVCIKLNKLLKLKVQDVERIKKIVNTNFFITSDAQRITSFAEVELGRIVTYNVGEAERIDANNILNKGLYDVEWEVEDVGGNFDEATAKKEKRIFKLVNTMKNAATDWPTISLISDANPFEIQLKAVKLGEYKIRAKIYNDTGLTKTLYDVIEFEQFVNDVDEKIASLSTFEKLKKALEMVKWKREIDIGALAKSLWNSIPMILFIAALIISCGEIASAIIILMSLADGCRNINDGFTKVAQGFETVKNAGSENALRHGGELIHEGLIIFGLGTIEVFLSKCTMKNVHTARIQLLKGETKAIVQSGTKALPSAAMKEITSSTSTAVPALTEMKFLETMAESAKKTSLVLADVPVTGEEKNILENITKNELEKAVGKNVETLNKVTPEIVEKVCTEFPYEFISKISSLPNSVELFEILHNKAEYVKYLNKKTLKTISDSSDVKSALENMIKQNEEIVRIGNEKAYQIVNIEKQSKTSAGPCLTTIYDPELNQYFYGQNFEKSKVANQSYNKWIENDADEIIRKRYSPYKYQYDYKLIILPDYIDKRLAGHSEIRALDELLKARRSAGLPVDDGVFKELFIYNIDLREYYKTGNIKPKPRCPNCTNLTNGVNTILHE